MNNNHLVNIAIDHINKRVEDNPHGIKSILGELAFMKPSDLIVGDNVVLGPNATITWENFAEEVITDLEEVQMRWLGSLDVFPDNPTRNDAFYHTVDLKSYIYNGTSWQMIAQNGEIGPQGEQGPQGLPGSYYAPGYLNSTYIGPTSIHSPTLLGETIIGSTGQVGMTAYGTANTDVRFWAGNTFANRASAPFQVRHDGSVYMTKAHISTEVVDYKYVDMQGSRIDGGRVNYGASYTIGTAEYSNANRAGIVQLYTFPTSTSQVANKSMQIGNNSIMASGCNLVLGGYLENRPIIITKRVLASHLTLTPKRADTALYCDSCIETKDILVKNSVSVIDTDGIIYPGIDGFFRTADDKLVAFRKGIVVGIIDA